MHHPSPPPPIPVNYWHAVPLTHLPRLLETGALRCARDLPPGVRPRSSAARRRRLGLEGFVHLSLEAATPLLADQRRRGIAHALLAFDAAVADLPGAGMVRFNTKSWRHREEFAPATDPAERLALLAAWRGGHFPSLELVVPGAVALRYATGLYFASERESAWLAALVRGLGLDSPARIVSPRRFPPGPPPDLEELDVYADACLAAGYLLPLPGEGPRAGMDQPRRDEL